jgi:hypothetical protein
MTKAKTEALFALCIEDADCGDLEKGKVYCVLPDESAAKDNYLRVVDESGEDYLYPESHFVLVKLPAEAQKALLRELSSYKFVIRGSGHVRT